MADWPLYTKTRFPDLGYCKCDHDLWRIVDLSVPWVNPFMHLPPTIGPLYKTKAELLGDLERYAQGYYGPDYSPK